MEGRTAETPNPISDIEQELSEGDKIVKAGLIMITLGTGIIAGGTVEAIERGGDERLMILLAVFSVLLVRKGSKFIIQGMRATDEAIGRAKKLKLEVRENLFGHKIAPP